MRGTQAMQIASPIVVEAETADNRQKAGRHSASPRDERPQGTLGGNQIVKTQAKRGERQKLHEGLHLLGAVRLVTETDRLLEMAESFLPRDRFGDGRRRMVGAFQDNDVARRTFEIALQPQISRIDLDVVFAVRPHNAWVSLKLWKQAACRLPEANFERPSENPIIGPAPHDGRCVSGEEDPAFTRARESEAGLARSGVAAQKHGAPVERNAGGMGEVR